MSSLVENLRSGHKRYRDTRLPEYQPLFKKLADRGQDPKALVIACSDSRVDPTLMFDQDPGDLFIVRNVANVVPPYEPKPGYHGTSAALEFAIKGLEVTDIIVMGHAQCGGVNALIEMADGEPPVGEFIGPWMSIAMPAVQDAGEAGDGHIDPDRTIKTELAVVRLSIQNLQTFPWVTSRVADGSLNIHGFYFDIRNGFVHWLNPEKDRFEDFV
ncbi:MAG: carbonic anhydrase [Rhodospirillaceae bacterium]|jgi:carbonic anhydrase|nr:carbonic anhydrase [Rhodospirillaceae bacterium]MBT6089709.1 carbonic anhydrase [Rhodospirillaceae bacterium]MBT6959940.1 carbonic anhydrase [Rhodospirillaceae bacterium]MBT7450387.1 carbonic anhydrase [Rhodospirillaceae bacterium]